MRPADSFVLAVVLLIPVLTWGVIFCRALLRRRAARREQEALQERENRTEE